MELRGHQDRAVRRLSHLRPDPGAFIQYQQLEFVRPQDGITLSFELVLNLAGTVRVYCNREIGEIVAGSGSAYGTSHREREQRQQESSAAAERVAERDDERTRDVDAALRQ